MSPIYHMNKCTFSSWLLRRHQSARQIESHTCQVQVSLMNALDDAANLWFEPLMSLWQRFGPLIGRLDHRSAAVVQCGLLAVRYRLGDCRAKSYLEIVAPVTRPGQLQGLLLPLTTRQFV